MDKDDGFEAEPGKRRGARSFHEQKYLGRVIATARKLNSALSPRSRRPRFIGNRIGRGGAAALALTSDRRSCGFRARHTFVKCRVMRFRGSSLAAARAHLRYLERDGVGREGEPGQLYSAEEDRVDGRAFIDRCSDDRHHFRLIVAADDAAQYEHLKPVVRRFMARMEKDLGTRLEWVAADHFDTFAPHTHRIEGDRVPWRPLRAFDDGRQVFIEFPPSLAQGEAPPLFLRGADGGPELVNYRVRGRYYVVDRLFQTAELRLGGKQVVRIVRDVPRSRRGS